MKIAVIILAAGQSRRFGEQNKLLAHFAGEPLVVGLVRRASAVRFTGVKVEIMVVVAGSTDPVAVALADCGLERLPLIVSNPHAADGMGSSIAAGIAALHATISAAVIVPGDMPLLSAAFIERLIAAFMADGRHRPAHPVSADGTQLSPVIWPRSMFDKLCALTGDTGGKSLLRALDPLRIMVGEPHELVDVDTPDDLAILQGDARPLRH